MWVRFPPGPFPRPRSRRDRPSRLILLALASAALHLAVLLALLLRPPQQPEVAPPPAEFAMVFQSGSPKPAPRTSPGARPATPPAARPAEAASPPAPVTRKAVSPPAPPVAVQKHEAPSPTPPAPAKRPAASLPVVRPNLPNTIAPPLIAPIRPVQPQAAPPVPTRAAPRVAPPRAAPPTPHPPTRSSRLAATRFPAPIMRNFFIPSAESSGTQRLARAVASNEAAPVRQSPRNPSFDLQGAESLGPDWVNAFVAWFKEHSIYPPQAIANNEEGDTSVEFTVDRYGQVKDVRLVGRSGSVWLDMETTGVLRDAHVPPFPYGTVDNSRTLHFTVHYILLH